MRKTALALVFMMLICGSRANSSVVEWPNGHRLTAKNGMFVDYSGRQVILRGVNAGMRSKLPPFFPFEPEPDFETSLNKYADILQSLGMNVVRLLIMFEAAEPERGTYDEEYLAKYDAMIDAFAERGFYVIVDSHQDVFSRRFCGDGFPDWVLAPKYRDERHKSNCLVWENRYLSPQVLNSFDRLWGNTDGVQDRYIEFFKMLAARYRNRPEVIGFEPINEPFVGWWGLTHYGTWHEKQLYPFFERVAAAVHSVDQRFIIFTDICPMENPGTWKKDRERPDIDNLALAPHYYDMGYMKFLWFNPGGGIEKMREGLAKHTALSRAWGVPSFVGEYGVSMHRDDAAQYLTRLYTVYDEMELSGSIWEASMSENIWNKRDKNIMAPDGTVKEPAFAIDRPYPRAVAGTIDDIMFDTDPAASSFTLKWSEEMRVNASTVVYLPERIFGSSPCIVIGPPSDYEFDVEKRLLVVRPLHRKVRRTLSVSPGDE
ncbi:cellulase family glycosylhydrolase [bacterium]